MNKSLSFKSFLNNNLSLQVQSIWNKMNLS